MTIDFKCPNGEGKCQLILFQIYPLSFHLGDVTAGCIFQNEILHKHLKYEFFLKSYSS